MLSQRRELFIHRNKKVFGHLNVQNTGLKCLYSEVDYRHIYNKHWVHINDVTLKTSTCDEMGKIIRVRVRRLV